MQLIDGHKIADRIKDKTVKDILEFNKQTRDLKQTKADAPHRPDLAIILVNGREDSRIYVDLKEKEGQKVGVDTHLYKCESDISTEEVVEMIDYLNNDPKIDGVFVQLPLPRHLDTDKIINAIDPRKDVDGFHQESLKQLKETEDVSSLVLPPAFQAVAETLKEAKVELSEKKVCIVANANIFKDNLSLFLEKQGAQTVVSSPEEEELDKKTRQADIIVTAVGKPRYLTGDMIKKDSVLLDMGVTKEENKVCGDVDKESVKDKVSYLTPVPGGLGPITVATTLKNVLELYKRKLKQQ